MQDPVALLCRRQTPHRPSIIPGDLRHCCGHRLHHEVCGAAEWQGGYADSRSPMFAPMPGKYTRSSMTSEAASSRIGSSTVLSRTTINPVVGRSEETRAAIRKNMAWSSSGRNRLLIEMTPDSSGWPGLRRACRAIAPDPNAPGSMPLYSTSDSVRVHPYASGQGTYDILGVDAPAGDNAILEALSDSR